MRAKGQPVQPPPNPTRVVRCYHCLHECEVSSHAMSSSCPHCYRQLAVADIVVRDRHWGGRLQTCGRILVERNAKVQVNCLHASAGIEVWGSVKGRIVSHGPVVLGDGCTIDGDLEAPAVSVAPGAQIVGGRFSISPVRGAE